MADQVDPELLDLIDDLLATDQQVPLGIVVELLVQLDEDELKAFAEVLSRHLPDDPKDQNDQRGDR